MKKILSLILVVCILCNLPTNAANEDQAAVSGDKGDVILTKRRDTATSTTAGTAGDYSTLNSDDYDSLWVHVRALDAITGTSFIDLKLIAGTNPSYYSTANANSFYWPGTTGATRKENRISGNVPGSLRGTGRCHT